mgnify:FL=1
MIEERFIQIYQDSFRKNWDLPALTDYSTQNTLLYKELAEEIAKVHILLQKCGIKKGDKIALVGKNTPQWCIVYMATITYGAVLVPILQDFNPQDICHIVNHSDSVLLFINDSIWAHIDPTALSQIRAAISIDKSNCLFQRDGEKIDQFLAGLDDDFIATYPQGFTPEDIVYADNSNEELAIINYTSGTTGFSKGVMLSGNNLAGNVMFGVRSHLHYRGSRCLSFLPLAHAYGCAFDFLVPLAVGSHITLLGKIPSPKILIKALAEVKPHLIICVPLVLEKIYRKRLHPLINKPLMRIALRIPIVNTLIFNKINKGLIQALGGSFEEVIVGGAPLNAEVESFLRKIKFPFTVGYGMTECAPLISYTPHREFIAFSSGRTLHGYVETKTIPEGSTGEICVRGEHVMIGYYKNEKATRDVIDSEGWLHTGDVGSISHDGTIFIKGRSKTMLLGANGQNIYPEIIEAKINNMPYVAESLVVERNNKLVALIVPDYEALSTDELEESQLDKIMEENRIQVNTMVAPYEKITAIKIHREEFEKTPKRSIKRYLYSK